MVWFGVGAVELQTLNIAKSRGEGMQSWGVGWVRLGA